MAYDWMLCTFVPLPVGLVLLLAARAQALQGWETVGAVFTVGICCSLADDAVGLRAEPRAVVPGDGPPAHPGVEVPDRKHLSRTRRYVLLNPCRAGIVRDPLE